MRAHTFFAVLYLLQIAILVAMLQREVPLLLIVIQGAAVGSVQTAFTLAMARRGKP